MSGDQTLKCADCGSDFSFTAEEQAFFQEKGYTNPPKRCATCRQKRRNQGGGRGRSGGGGGRRGGGGFRGGSGGGGSRGGGDKPRFTIVCNACGQEASVPFEPIQGRAVFCQSCYRERKGVAN